nr:hypothetical protein [Tanacetum cinerariifolium]
MTKVLLLAWDRVSKVKDAFGNKQYKPEDMQELFRKLFNDVQNIHEELAEYINTPSWNRPAYSNYDEVIKSSVEDLVPIPSDSEGILCSNNDSTLIDDDYFSIDTIDYVEASPLDSELVSLDGEIEDDNLGEKLLNINLLITKIEYLKDNPTSDRVLKSPSLFPIPLRIVTLSLRIPILLVRNTIFHSISI